MLIPRFLAVLSATLLAGQFALAADAPVAAPPAAYRDSDWKALPAHPRLYANAARFASVRDRQDDVSLALRALLRREADRELAAAPIIYPAEGMALESMRNVQGRILALAMEYRLSGERRYFEGARRELLQLAALRSWNPGHFLDAAEAALGAGVGLDWLYDDLSPAERDQIAQAIVKNALLPSLEVQPGGNSWLRGDFNWNQVCNAGLTVGALAVAEREPRLARQIIDRAVDSLPYAGAVYAPDGTYAEGPSYWAYGTTFHVLLCEALRSAFGTSLGLEKPPGFLESADFIAQMLAPTGAEYNYSDYNGHEARNVSEPVMLWFARERKSAECARTELASLRRLAALDECKAPPLSRHLALELLWWNPTLPPPSAVPTLPLHWTAGGKLPLAVLRSGWNDRRAAYLALKGGTPDGSHAHMDVGSFVFEVNGVRWARDLGAESYDGMRAAKIDLWNYSQASSRWTVFRPGPDAHNILRFNGSLQDVASRADIRALPDKNGVVGNVVELSSIYKGEVESVRRTVQLYPDRSISITDEWTTGQRPAEVTWQWLTTAKAIPSSVGVSLSEDGELLELKVEGSTPFQIRVEDVSRPAGPADSPNPGLSRVVISLTTPAASAGTLRVKAVPGVRPVP